MEYTQEQEPFEGDRGAAEARLRELTELAIQSLPTNLLNVASYHIAVYIDVMGPGHPTVKNTKRMRAELDNERDELRAWWNQEGPRLVP